MRARMLLAFAILFVWMISSQTQAEEATVLLKDGTVIKGRILSEGDKVIRIQTPYGEFSVDKADVKEIQRRNPRPQVITRKDPGIAGILSFLCPGLGQIYAENPEKGVKFLVWGLLPLGVSLGFLAAAKEQGDKGDEYSEISDSYLEAMR